MYQLRHIIPIVLSILGFFFILIAIVSNLFIYVIGLLGTVLFIKGNKWLARQISAEMIYRRCPFCKKSIYFSFNQFECKNCGKQLNIKISESVYINKPYPEKNN